MVNDTALSSVSSAFHKESEKILRIDVNGSVWLKLGAAIAYRGELNFRRVPTIAKGISVKEMAMREITPFAEAIGQGTLYCANQGRNIQIKYLEGQIINLNCHTLIAFEESLQHEVYLLHHGKGIIGGGMFGVCLSGHGAVCFSARGGLLRLQVTDQAPLFTDPNSTLAWSEGVSPAFKTDLGWRSLFKHGGGEPIQMLFQGNGLVAVEPGEEPYPVSGHLIKKIAKAFGL